MDSTYNPVSEENLSNYPLYFSGGDTQIMLEAITDLESRCYSNILISLMALKSLGQNVHILAHMSI